MLRIKTRR